MLIDNETYQSDLAYLAKLDLPWHRLTQKTILVTGASGLICSFLVDYLMYRNYLFNDQINIIIIGRNENRVQTRFSKWLHNDRFLFIKQDISEPLNISSNVDYIIHGASNADPLMFSKDPVGIMKANILGMYNLLELAKSHNSTKTLFLSSAEVYGIGDNIETGFPENFSGYVDCTDSRACYPSSKRAAETLCVSYHKQYQQKVVIARPCHVYGATFTEQDSRVFAQFFRNAMKGENIVLKSDGAQIRSYCYVADAVSALFYILFWGESSQAYNIADRNSTTSIRNLAEMISTAKNLTLQYEIPDLVENTGYSKVKNLILDPTKLEDIGWRANTDLIKGINKIFSILI
jgi:UDP-glucuronate decarboxylase